MIAKNQLNSFTLVYEATEQNNKFSDLNQYFAQHQSEIMDEIHRYGIVLFRGFQIQDAEEFQHLIQDSLGLTSWNSFNSNMPAWIASGMRKYSENLLGAGDYRRYLDRNTVQLGPVENSIQGPHVEGGVRSQRAKYIALYCSEPSIHLAETGFNSLTLAWSKLSSDTQNKYAKAWNRFSYISARKLKVIDRLLLKRSPFQIQRLKTGHAKLSLIPTPFVIQHPHTRETVLQPWAFAKNLNHIAYQTARSSFSNRGELNPDSTAEGMQLTWEIVDKDGQLIEWHEHEKQMLFKSLYENAFLLQWKKGDIAIVDNIKIAHWRMNGLQGNRKLIQIQANPFDANMYQHLCSI